MPDPVARDPSPAAADLTAFLARHPEADRFDLLIPDQLGILRGKRVGRAGAVRAVGEGLMLPGSIFALDALGADVHEAGLAFDVGDADQACFPVAGRFAPVPWLGPQHAQALLHMVDGDGAPFYGEPRAALARVLAGFQALGLTPVIACELEFYLIDPVTRPDGGPQPARRPGEPDPARRLDSRQPYGLDDVDAIGLLVDAIGEAVAAQALPADTVLAENGPGQYEVNLRHRADALAACDDAVMLKRLIKGVARAQGYDATFMAKPYAEEPGNGLHVHVSLADSAGRNIFAHGWQGRPGESLLQAAIAGLQVTAGEALAFFAPSANSFRRLRPETYAPASAAWGENNRTCALRIPAGPADARRVEHRIAGADANPYLTAAAVLAGVLHGITRQLAPSPKMTANGYTATGPERGPPLPQGWGAALDACAAGTVLPAALGASFHQLFVMCRRAEKLRFEAIVSPTEWSWYLRTA